MVNGIGLIPDVYGATPVKTAPRVVNADQGFKSILSSSMQLLNDVNTLGKKAEGEEIAFALGESDNLHDLLIAEQKASIALQYTVAIKNKVIESYNSIMQMQI